MELEGSRVIEAFEEVLRELIDLTPAILISLLIFSAFLVIIKFMNKAIRSLLRHAGFDELLEKVVGRLPISLETITIILADTGLIILAITIILTLFAPSFTESYHMYLSYLLRIFSTIVLTIVTLFWIEALVNRIRAETKIRAFASLLVFLLVLAFIIDITALSESVKSWLVFGIALGIGFSIGIFALWYFLHDYIETYLRSR
ncbi:MAG: hypothetical protein B6U85_07540 [Desulfurococcales archaeon ex4484_42]|nr:MAG: hypothetical protein B6U85_07540 [Desulfurococcales archaeon ex4484_42]